MTGELMSWQPRNTASNAQPKVTRSVNCYPNLTTRPSSPYHRHVMRLTDHHMAGTKRQLKPNTSPYYLAVKVEMQQLGDIHMTYGKTWTVEQVRPDRSTDCEDVHRHTTTATYSDVTNLATPGPKITNGLHRRYVAVWPNIEAPHTLFASLTKSWNMNSQKGLNP